MVPANNFFFQKIKNLKVLEVPNVSDVILIYKWIYESIFKRNPKFRGSRGSRGSKVSGVKKIVFQKVENIEVLEVQEVPDVKSIFKSIQKLIFQET